MKILPIVLIEMVGKVVCVQYRRNTLYRILSYVFLAIAVILIALSVLLMMVMALRIALILIGLFILVIAFSYFRLSGRENKEV